VQEGVGARGQQGKGKRDTQTKKKFPVTYLEFMTAWVALLRRSCWPPLPPAVGAGADISLVAGLDMLPDLPDGSEGQAEWECEKPQEPDVTRPDSLGRGLTKPMSIFWRRWRG
jgi:hypothetical protein